MTQYAGFPSRGWTLVELLVALTLSLLVIAGVGEIYLAAKRSYEIQTNLTQIQDVGRYTVETLTQDIRNAGYWGLMSNTATITGDSAFATDCVNSTWGKMVTQKIFGLNDDPSVSIPTAYSCIGTDYKRGDVLTLRYADPDPVTSYDATADANRLFIRTTPFTGTLFTGPPSLNPTLPNPPFFADYRLVAHTYYVANSSTAGECGTSAAPWLPALDREYLDSNGAPRKEELVTGVEQLQFLYGVDTDGDGSVNQYRNANSVTTDALWPKVRAVRFWVLVRSSCKENGYNNATTYQMGDYSYSVNDSFRRALYTSTVALTN